MRNIWVLTRTNMMRNKIIIYLTLVGAFLLCFLMYSMGRMVSDVKVAKIKIGIIDQDDSILSEDFKGYLKNKIGYELIEHYTYDELSSELIERHISAIIEIPKDFYQNATKGELQGATITTLDDYENAAFLEAYLNNYFTGIKILVSSANGSKETFDQILRQYQAEDIVMTTAAAGDMNMVEENGKNGFIISVGFFLMIIFGFSIAITFTMLDDKMKGILDRIQITPVKPIHYIIGSALFGSVICFIMIFAYCSYIIIMKVQTGVPFRLIVLQMIVFSLFTILFSIASALFFKTKNAVMSVVMGFSTIGAVLGGAYFPLDLAPKSLQNLAKIVPQYWFMDSFRTLQAKPDANVIPNVIVLILYTVLAFLIGAVLFSQNYNKN